MKKINIVVGGSKGLGKKIIENYTRENIKCISISRTRGMLRREEVIEHELDLIKFEDEELEKIFMHGYTIDTVIFSQRYRAEKEIVYSDEYKVQVESTAKIIRRLIKRLDENKQNTVCSIVIVGSTYAEEVGMDQDWGYHACKAGQYSLTKFFALRSEGRFTINYACPATYVKEGTQDYWNRQEKQRIWNKYPTKRLATDGEIAQAIIELAKNKNIFNNGNIIMLDGGVSNLYHDQRAEC